MHNDYRSPNRENWKYAYKASELYEAACDKYLALYRAEQAARQESARLTVDMNVAANGGRRAELERLIDKYASEREQCGVFVHEFRRLPDREYQLALSDVVYLGLVERGGVLDRITKFGEEARLKDEEKALRGRERHQDES